METNKTAIKPDVVCHLGTVPGKRALSLAECVLVTSNVNDDDLHWLRINERIQYKLASITFNAIKIGQPSYLSELLLIHVPTRLYDLNHI